MKTRIDYSGIYRAQVISAEDGSGTGRVRIRVPAINGGANSRVRTPDSDLSWAFRLSPFPEGDGYGSYVLPQKGDWVWVVFEDGDPKKPVVLGSVPSTGYRRITGDASDTGKYTLDYPTSGGSETFSEGRGYGGYNVSCLYKSPKGAAILINEGDESESLSIIDRSGQGLFFSSPVSSNANVGNAAARNSHSALIDGGINPSFFTEEGTSVTLAGSKGQKLVFGSNGSGSSITLSASNGMFDEFGGGLRFTSNGVNSTFELSTKGQGGSTSIKGDGTDLELNSSFGGLFLVSKTSIAMSSEDGDISMESKEAIKLKSKGIDLTAEAIEISGDIININGDIININGDVTINGNLLVTGIIKAENI